MMKKILTLVLILMLSLFTLLADDTTDTLTVKAYKKSISTTPTFEPRVIDALTGSLDVLENNAVITMDNYINKFLGTLDDVKNIRNKAIFSFHVGGNRVGTYTVQITFQSLAFYSDYKDSGTRKNEKYITAQYFLEDMNSYFSTRAQSVTLDSGVKEEISTPAVVTNTNKNVIVYGSNTGTLNFTWTVSTTSTTDTTKTETTWDIEAMVAMILLKDTTTVSGTEYLGYSDVDNGSYMAPIEIKMWVNN